MPNARRGLAVLWLSLFTAVLLRTAWVGDDAYFTFRTIDNFVHGFGLRWNVAERVQAYTHPLWLIVMTPFYRLTGEPYFTSIAVSIALTLATVLVLLRRAPSVWTAAAGLTMLIGSRAFIDYSTSGLENPLTHLLLVLFLFRAISERRATLTTSLLAALLLLNRLDLVFLVLPPFLTLIPWRGPRRAWTTLAMGFLPLVVWELFSIVYYGFPAPNTAYAKVQTGVAERDLFVQGVTYLLDSLARDPLTLLVTVGVASWAVIENPRRTRPIGIGILLHIAVVTYAGGDFMSGRLFAAPFAAAVVIFVSADAVALFAYRWMPTVLAGAIGALAFQAIAAGQAIADSRDLEAASGISDERGYYFRSNGLIAFSREAPYWPRSSWIENGLQARAEGPHVIVYCCNGMLGYAAGPTIHIVDTVGLGDPLMARLPAEKGWRIGHFGRPVPRGYTATLETGANHIVSPSIATYYSRLALVTRGPIWDRRRWQAIARLNLGGYASLLRDAANGTPACGYTLLRSTEQFATGGGRSSLTAAASSQSGCSWTARASDPWIRLRDRPSGEGTGTLNFSVDANATPQPRSGTITIAWGDGDATFTIRQNGISECRYILAPSAQTADTDAKDFSVTVTPSDASCGWKAEADVPWIAIASGSNNTGAGTIVYRVQANATSARRAGAIRVTGLVTGASSLAVTQLP